MKFLDAGPWTATINAERVPPGNFHPGGQLAHNALRDTLASRVGDLASNVPLARHQTRATRRAKIEFLGPLIDVAFALVFSSTLRKPCRVDAVVYAGHTGCQPCWPGYISSSGAACWACPPGTTSNAQNTMCVTCAVGEYSIGEWSPFGFYCMKCSAGYSNNRFHTGCDECARGKYSREGGACHKCAAGKASNAARTACDPCAAGSVSGAGQHSCDICGAGTWSTADQPAPCHECGDDDSVYNKYVWDPSQSGLTSSDSCKCARGPVWKSRACRVHLIIH